MESRRPKRLPFLQPPPLPLGPETGRADKADAKEKKIETTTTTTTVDAASPLRAKERVFYSDVVRPNSEWELDEKVRTIGSPNLRDMIRQKRRLPGIGANNSAVKASQSLGSLAQLTSSSNASAQVSVLEPKVMIAHEAQAGQTPRKLEIERRKRLYAEQDMRKLLAQHGITEHSYGLVDLSNANAAAQASAELQSTPARAFLPLHVFDDREWDERTEAEWLSLAPNAPLHDLVTARVPVPAKALTATTPTLVWENVLVTGFDARRGVWKVVPDPAFTAAHAYGWLELWLHRVDVMFLSEDPFRFAQRVQAAHARRRAAESNLRFHFYIDCMPMPNASAAGEELDGETVGDAAMRRIFQVAAPKQVQKVKGFMQSPWVQGCIRDIRTEYTRTLNAITLEAHVSVHSTFRIDSRLTRLSPCLMCSRVDK